MQSHVGGFGAWARAAGAVGVALGLTATGIGVAHGVVGAPVANVELPDRTALGTAPQRFVTALDRLDPGHWDLVWDATSRSLWSGVRGSAPPGSVADAGRIRAAAVAFEARHAALFASATGLELARCERLGNAWHVTWVQQFESQPILDAWLDVTLDTAANVVAFQSRVVPALRPEPSRLSMLELQGALRTALGKPARIESTQRLFVALGVEALQLVPAVRFECVTDVAMRWDVVVSAVDARVLRLDCTLHDAALTGAANTDIPPLYAQEPPSSYPLAWIDVALRTPSAAWSTTSRETGWFSIEAPSATTGTLQAALAGPYLRVTNDAGPNGAWSGQATAPGRTDVHFGPAQARLDERCIYVHAMRIHDFVKSRFGFTLLDFPVPAVAAARDPMSGDSSYANAYWDGRGLHFGTGASTFFDFGMFADVVYHEYTHAITDYMYRPFGGLAGLQGSALHEALSDYFACTLTNDPEMGEHMYRGAFTAALRTMENDLHWPEDARYQAHADGAIFGGGLWDLRRLVGPAVADPLVHFARAHGAKKFDAFVDAILLEDDLQFGDGQSANGSPHRDAIRLAFAAHGFGPDAILGRRLQHERLRDTESVGRSRPVSVRFEGSLSSQADTLRLYYWPSGGPLVRSNMRRLANGDFVGEIPGRDLTYGTVLRYYMKVEPHRRLAGLTSPPGAPDSLWVFRVGPDLEPPSIEHFPIASASALGWPARVIAHLDDNLGIANAWVEYRLGTGPLSTLGMVRAAADPSLYLAQFPNVGGLGDVIEYRIIAVDASQAAHRSGFPPFSAPPARFTIIEGLRDNFETGAGAWQHASLDGEHPEVWHWSDRDNHTPAGMHAMRCGSVGSEYPIELMAVLETEEYPIGPGARARIWSRMDAEPNGPHEAFDAGVVQMQLDGAGTWEPITPRGGYTHVMAATGGTNGLPAGTPCLSGRDNTWRQLDFDLDPYAGHRLRLRFLFASDNSASPFGLQGWALDDFDLEPGARSPTDVETPPPGSRLLAAPPVPNPSRGWIGFTLSIPHGAGPVGLALYDVHGRRLRRLLDADMADGPRHVVWDGRDDAGVALPSGVYYYRLVSRAGLEHGRLVLAR